MKRLTMDNVEEMGMYNLAHNCCYIDENRNTRYRDFEIDIDARELAKGLLRELTEDVVSFESDEDFDDWMWCCIGEDDICTPRGLIVTFYHNLWAMAELREKLKYYEDLADQEAYRWRDAEQEKPPEGEDVLCCISGKWDHIIYDHAYAVGSYWTEDEEWEFDCVPAHESDRVTVHQWKRIEKPQRKGAKK